MPAFPMKRLLPCLLAAALAVPAVLSAAAFEGKVNFTLTTAKGPQQLAYSIKGDKMRMDLPGTAMGAGGIIMDLAKHEVTVVMDAQHMYMTNPLPDPSAPSPDGKAAPQGSLEKAGEKEKILGYDAEKYIATGPDGAKTELWLTNAIGTFMPFSGGGPMGRGGRGGPGAGGQAWERALAGKDLFPLRVVTHDKDGKEFRMESTAIDKASLPDSLFEPPAGYQKFDMQSMMRGAMPGGFGGKRP